MTAGGLTAFTGVKNKQCLRTNSRLQRLSVKEVLSPLLKATLSQVKESKRTGNQTHDLFFFPPEEMVFKIWEVFVLGSDFFSDIFMHTLKSQLVLKANTSIRGRRRVCEYIILSQC